MKNVCDAHLHFYDASYPIASTTVLRPPDASPSDYEVVAAELGVERAVIVQPTTYGLDNRCQIDGAEALPFETRLIVVVDETTDLDAIAAMHEQGARGARFHMLPGGAVDWDAMAPVARAIAEHGWHVQLQMNGRDLADRLDLLLELPTDVVVDHVGRFMPPAHPDHPGVGALLALLESGKGWVKLSAPYESAGEVRPDYPEVEALVDLLVARHPDRMLWASNWPHPGQAAPPTPPELAAQRKRWIPEDLRARILVDNPARLYGFGD